VKNLLNNVFEHNSTRALVQSFTNFLSYRLVPQRFLDGSIVGLHNIIHGVKVIPIVVDQEVDHLGLDLRVVLTHPADGVCDLIGLNTSVTKMWSDMFITTT
jgi:hypothetical protein